MWFKCLHKSLVCCQIDYQCNFGKATCYFNSSALLLLWSSSVFHIPHNEECGTPVLRRRRKVFSTYMFSPPARNLRHLSISYHCRGYLGKVVFFISRCAPHPSNKHVSPCSTSRTNQHQTGTVAAGLSVVDKQLSQ